MRGYDRNRFAGDSSFYTNAQVMIALFNLNLVLPLRVLTTDLVAHALLAQGDEGLKFYVNIGFGI